MRIGIVRYRLDILILIDIRIVCIPNFLCDLVENGFRQQWVNKIFISNKHEVLDSFRHVVKEKNALCCSRLEYISIAPIQIDVVVR